MSVTIFAGPNGSGKSTIRQKWIDPRREVVCADDIKRELGCSDPEATQEAQRRVLRCVQEGRDCVYETVLSSDYTVGLLERVHNEYSAYIVLHFVVTTDPQLDVVRVQSRELSGGHPVPREKILSRFTKSIANIPRLLVISTTFTIIDNTLSAPSVIFIRDSPEQMIRPNQFFSKERIENLLQGKFV